MFGVNFATGIVMQ